MYMYCEDDDYPSLKYLSKSLNPLPELVGLGREVR